MKILALEFSSSQRSVALVQPLDGAASAFQSEVIEAGGRSTAAFGMIERALGEARIPREEIDCLAVGLGPGSYTGIRAAIALAQGWQLARGIRLLGISTVEVLVAQGHADGLRGTIHVVIDAQRGEFYCATWHLTDEHCTETEPLRIVNLDIIGCLLADGDPVCGPNLKRHFPKAREVFPSALQLGRLASSRSDFIPGEELRPIYLRQTSFVKAPPPRQI